MTALMNALTQATTIATRIQNKMLITGATIEEFAKGDMELTFCKGTDAKTGLKVSVLVATDTVWTASDFAVLVNVTQTKDGSRANEAIKLAKEDYTQLLSQQPDTQQADI